MSGDDSVSLREPPRHRLGGGVAFEIEDDQVGLVLIGPCRAVLRLVGRVDVDACAFQRRAEHFARLLERIDDQHAFFRLQWTNPSVDRRQMAARSESGRPRHDKQSETRTAGANFVHRSSTNRA